MAHSRALIQSAHDLFRQGVDALKTEHDLLLQEMRLLRDRRINFARSLIGSTPGSLLH